MIRRVGISLFGKNFFLPVDKRAGLTYIINARAVLLQIAVTFMKYKRGALPLRRKRIFYVVYTFLQRDQSDFGRVERGAFVAKIKFVIAAYRVYHSGYFPQVLVVVIYGQ